MLLRNSCHQVTFGKVPKIKKNFSNLLLALTLQSQSILQFLGSEQIAFD